MMPAPSLTPPTGGEFLELKPLLREAAEWRLLGLLFERPRGSWWREISSLAPEIFDPGLRAAISGAARATEPEYLALVGPGAPVNLRSIAHRKASDPGHVFAEIRAMFEAFGFAPHREDTVDHASVLCGFVGYLRLKEALARADEDTRDAEVSERIASLVIRDHLAMLAEPVCHTLFEREASYLALAAQALLERVGRRPADVEGGWAPDGLIPAGLVSDEVTCG
jgi:nitrate reductase assembly molybdenum cofactor insertion protein NarJ